MLTSVYDTHKKKNNKRVIGIAQLHLSAVLKGGLKCSDNNINNK